ncbi:MAG: PLD nuclease N-terminal domain-containing protein [Alistipes finegoldii]
MYIVLLLHLAWALMAVPVVTRQQRVPASAATWLALILLLPVAGTLLYVLAGYRPHLPAAERRAYRGDRLDRSSHGAAAHASPATTASNCSTTATTPSRR